MNNSSTKDSTYSTKDTALAALLYSNGFELLEVDSSSFPSIFLFRNDSPELPRLVHDYQCGKAEGNIVIFFKAYKLMLTRIKEGKS